MSAAARRGHPQCACCGLPVGVRAQLAKRRRAGDSLRSISEWLVSEGYGIGKDGVAQHLRSCVGLEDNDDGQSRSVRVAAIVGQVTQGLPRLTNDIAEALAHADLPDEATALQIHLDEGMRRALEATAGTPTAELLGARCLAFACNKVLRVAHPEVAREIAKELQAQGADVLADDLRWLAQQATTNLAETATTDRRSEVEAISSPGSGKPPTVADEEETA